jgi:hypothetical protein
MGTKSEHGNAGAATERSQLGAASAVAFAAPGAAM